MNEMLSKRMLFKPEEAAEALGISSRTLWQLTKDKEIPYVQIGGTTRKIVRYALCDLEQWVERKKRESQGDQSA